MVKVVHGVGEEGKVAVRNIRRDVMHDLRELKKEGEVGEDDERRAETELQKRTDEATQRDRRPAEGQGRRDPRGVSGSAERADATSPSSPTATGAGPRSAGCRRSTVIGAGADVVKARLRDAAEFGIEELTVFSFSTENWQRPRAEVDGLMAMFAERIDRETPELDEEGVRMRFIGRREGVARGAGRAHGVGRGGRPPRTSGSPCSSPSTTAAGRRSSTRREASRASRGGVPRPPLRARDERPRPPDPHQRRAADLELPALAVRLLGARLQRRALARLRPRGVRVGAGRVRDPRRGASAGR